MVLQKGENCPHFKLRNQSGDWVDIRDYLHKERLVIYFYPRDETGGCTKEACTFRDRIEEFNRLDARIFGISSDDLLAHMAFAGKHRLNFDLLSDPDGRVKKLFGIRPRLFGLLPRRVTFVVGLDGKIAASYESLLDAASHVDFAQRILERSS